MYMQDELFDYGGMPQKPNSRSKKGKSIRLLLFDEELNHLNVITKILCKRNNLDTLRFLINQEFLKYYSK